MKKNFTRTLSILLACLILIGIVSMSVNAASNDGKIRSGDFDYYILSNGTIWLDAYYGGEENLEIPSSIDGYEVYGLGRTGAQWFFNEGMNFKNTKTIKLPKTLIKFAANTCQTGFANWYTLENIYVDDENPVFKSKDGVLYNSDMTELLFYPEGKKDIVFKVPDSVSRIKGGFTYNKYLQKVYLNANLTEIYEYSFYNYPNLVLYVYPDSYGLEWAQNHDFEYVIMEEEQIVEKGLVDTQTGIKANGLMDSEATLKVESVENSLENSIATYDITLEKDGNIIQPSGEVTVSIPCEYSNCNIFSVNEDGTQTNMNAKYEDGNYVFQTDKLSKYVILKTSIGLLGDSNQDGKVDILDATQIQKELANIIEFSDDQKKLSNVDGNNVVNILDVTIIQKYLAKIDCNGYKINEKLYI